METVLSRCVLSAKFYRMENPFKKRNYQMLLSSLHSELLTTSFEKLWQLTIAVLPNFQQKHTGF